MRTLPGTRALKMLVSAGRHLNFTRAADELGLTPAAVSYQVKEIEDQLGVKLFVRTNRSIHLTPEGKVLCEAAADALEIVTKATVRIQKMSRSSTTQLKVAVSAEFATKWLLGRVERFRKVQPDIELRFDVSYELKDFELDDIDVAIRYGSGKYPGLTAHRLFGNVIVPVCSPRLLASGKPLNEPRDLMHHTLAHIDWSRDGLTWPNWQMWMAAAGVHDFDDSRTLAFETSNDAVEAALVGEAVALADFAMVANELSEGRLVRPFELSVKAPSEFAYFLVYPTEAETEPRTAAFRDWLLGEVAASHE